MPGNIKRAYYIPSNLDKDSLDAVIAIPCCKDRELRGLDVSVDLIDEREIHARHKLDNRREIGIAFSTSDLKAVDAVLMHGLERGQDG